MTYRPTWLVPAVLSLEPQGPRRVHVALVMAEPEYETGRTLPIFAARMLHSPLGHEIVEVAEDALDPRRLSRVAEALEIADVVILSVRRRALASDEMKALRQYLAAGKPLIGIRTANHAFAPREPVPTGFEAWTEFDAQVIGGNYTGHYGVGPVTTVKRAEGVAGHAILHDVPLPFETKGSLYKVSPLQPGAVPLLMGTIPGQPAEPIAWTYQYDKSKIFYTSLGYKEDFGGQAFPRLLRNAVVWALNKPRQ